MPRDPLRFPNKLRVGLWVSRPEMERFGGDGERRREENMFGPEDEGREREWDFDILREEIR